MQVFLSILVFVFSMTAYAENKVCADIQKSIESKSTVPEVFLAQVRSYIKSKCDLNRKFKGGNTVLMHVVNFPFRIDSTTSKYIPDITSVVKDLLAAGADPNLKVEDGTTALTIAVTMTKFPDVTKALIAGKADVNLKDEQGWTPLHWAAGMGNVIHVKVLIEAKADLNAKDENGKTPMQHASESNHEDVVQILMAAGAKEVEHEQ